MIDIEKLEQDLLESAKTETGKPFNKWMKETRTELMQQSLETIKGLNLEIEQHKNELVIDHNKVVVLEDVIDGSEDYYWCYSDWDGKHYQASCVGSHIRLKGYLPEEKYNRLVYTWNLNHTEPVI